ncbi:aminotransferase class V-fold PLP-dependent enzyme [bacterium]|nr:aminotransferase class V-fold PLP-dependent enzyme [bacterium]
MALAPHPLSVDPSEFPIRSNQIYLNHAGTSPIPRRSAEMLKTFADEVSGYASSIYGTWTKRLEQTRDAAAHFIGAHRDEIGFVKSTTAGLNLVGMGIAWKPSDVIIVEERTFPSNYLAWKAAEHYGAKLWYWPERNLRYELEDLEARLKQGGVRLVASTSAQFATGFRQDIRAVGQLCRQYGALHCVDAIQTLGVFPLDVTECAIDFLAADSHKWLMGPEGAALFYCAKDKLNLIQDHLIGWLGRENIADYDTLNKPPAASARRFEEGSPNVAGWMAMGESIKFLAELTPARVSEHNRSLCRALESGLEAAGWNVRSPRDEKWASSIVSATHDRVDYGALTAWLWNEHRIFAAVRRNALRLSPHVYQTEDEMARVVAAVAAFRG